MPYKPWVEERWDSTVVATMRRSEKALEVYMRVAMS